MKYYNKVFFKINVALVTSVTLMLAIFAYSEYKSMHTLLSNSLEQDINSAGSRLKESIINGLGDEQLVRSEMNIPHLHTVVLKDSNGAHITSFTRTSTHNVDSVQSVPELPQGLILDEVEGSNSNIGKISLYWSTAHIDAYLSDLLKQSIFKIAVLNLIIIFTIFVTTKSLITSPLHKLSRSFSDIAKGKGNLMHKIPVESKDEFGVLAKTFNNFQGGLYSIVSRVAHHSRLLLEQSKESSSYSEQVESDISRHTKYMQVISHAAALIKDFSANIAEASLSSSEFTNNTLDKTKQAKNNIETSINKTFVLAENIDKTSENMSVLSKDLEKISEIVEMIKMVSARSNILAYNATIEAAQAGESGKGFAIVATEMKDLAKKTNDAVVQVDTIIDEILDDKTKTMEVLSDTNSQAQSSVRQASLAAESLKDTMTYLQEMSGMSETISDYASRQQSLTSEFNYAIKEIEAVIYKIAETTEKSSGIANEVESLSSEMSEVVSNFTIREKDK